jgi:hypothetical protein
MMRRRFRRSLATLALLAAVTPATVQGQVAPNLHWETIGTAHFRVHYSDGLEAVARRAAGSAERAWGRLAAELVEPRGPVELVIADNVDYSNGYATLFPSNRIVVYSRPPVDGTSLKFLDDWFDLVLTHELTHVFHLDRSAGWWRLAQRVFGRNPFLFPGLYTPSWMDEGIAVYYESRITGAGRILGSEHAMIVRAHALEGTMPLINAWSASTTRYPLGQVRYAYGSLLMDYMARTQGASKMRAFIETTAGRTLPFLLNYNASEAFGISFDSASRAWADSVRRTATPAARVATPTLLTTRGWFAERLRWTSDREVIYAGNSGRELPALRALDVASGAGRAVADRTTLGTTSPLRDGSRLFVQDELTDPYTERSDLYLERDGVTTQLTRGARVVQPDARCTTPTGPCVPRTIAVQLVAGTTRLVQIEGDAITAITSAALDTIWAEPRWSHDGSRIVAARRVRGGVSDLVILDARGTVQRSFARARGVTVAPSWSPMDDAIYFTSDRTGRAALYRTELATQVTERVAESPTGLFESEVSPDGSRIATFEYRGDGYHVATFPANGARVRAESTTVFAPSRGDTSVTVTSAQAPSSPFTPWASLLPTYWLPAAAASDDQRTSIGFLTSGADVIGRHRYDALVTRDVGRPETTWDLSYAYAGYGNPIIGVTSNAEWDHFPVADSLRRPLGTLSRRKRFTGASITLQRPRYRSNAYLGLGVDVELRDFETTPASLLARLGSSYARSYTYPALYLNVGFGNARTTALGISPEDGWQVATTVRQRWRSDAASSTRSNSVIGYAQFFKSLDFGGPAHAVFAGRVAAGWEDDRAASSLEAGGVSGSILSVIPGITVGEGRRTFFVRGFPAAAQFGTQAMGASAELRVPLVQPNRGWWMLPLFLQKVNLTLFTDAASAWCPVGTTNTTVCSGKGSGSSWMQSVGGELQFDTALQYDVPYRLRLGTALPVTGSRYSRSGGATAYFSIGTSF